MLQCRLGYAEQVARSIALMSDEVWLYDYFSERFLLFGRRENFKFEAILDDVYVLHAIKPLIQAGILKFRSPFRSVCSGCLAEFERRVENLTLDLYKEYAKAFKLVRNKDGAFSLDTGGIYDPPLNLWVYPKTNAKPNKTKIAKEVMYKSIRASMWAARDAELVRGAIFSNSHVGLSGLLREEGRFTSSASLQALEVRRAATLPWIAGLSVLQTLQLREEANQALPRLREFLGSHLSFKKEGHVTTEQDYISQLREQAAEVRAELNVLRSSRSTLMRGALGIASLSICAYGFANETVVAVGQLLATLGLLHQVEAPEELHKTELKSRPGYVLVKAQEILQHARE